MALQFRPPLWSIAGTLAVSALFISLGAWQAGRGLHKRELESAYSSAGRQQVLTLDARTPSPGPLDTHRVQASGHYLADRQLLLDNQSREQTPGYRVWTPLVLEDGNLVLVDRGWLRQDPDRRKLPEVSVAAAPRTVRGYWRPVPEPGLKLEAHNCEGQGYPRIVNYPTPKELECLLGRAPMAGLLLLDTSEPDGFVRDWTLPNPVPPARHFAYAAQWWAFAATLLFLFVKLNLRRTP